jgi:hypothetical protein
MKEKYNMDIRSFDFGYDINFTVVESDGTTPVNLDDTTIKFNVVEIDSRRLIFSGDAVIVSETNGTCKYTVASTDFTKAGNYKGALVISWYTGTTVIKTVTTKDIFITVTKKIA